MYKLDRARRVKIILGVLTFFFLVVFFIAYLAGGCDLVIYGFLNYPFECMIMVCSLLSAVACLVGFFIVHALEKDIAEWLGILEKQIANKCQ